MGAVRSFDRSGRSESRWVLLFVVVIQALSLANAIALPRRLVLELDGISYRDMKALQNGVTYKDIKGREFHHQAFTNSYFPVSRNISTFPSTSDVAWTDIFGDRPLPGYQRTYFSEAENRQIAINSVTTSAEHERQVNWQVESPYRRAMAYVYPLSSFKYELRQMTENFLKCKGDGNAYYVYMRSTDDSQHMSGDIFAMLAMLDEKLKELRVLYKAQSGRDLEILIISDHGHNRAGAGKRVQVLTFLEHAGYRLAKSITDARDVVLPTCGIESWVEIHNSPAETEHLAESLCHLEGAELVMARMPGRTNHFLVMNANGEKATIDWNSEKNSFRYAPEAGDPIQYRPVMESLAKKNLLDSEGFATADDWMTETFTNHYPLALERIAHGLTCITLNPATILVSLSNGYVNASWFVDKASRLATLGGTHGGLDDINSDGIILSNFAPTHDTSTSRVAGLFDNFPGLQNYRETENGAEWVTAREQALTRIAREPFDTDCKQLPNEGVFLRIWTPQFGQLDSKTPVEVTIEKIPQFMSARIHRWEPDPVETYRRHLTLDDSISMSEQCAYERVYSLPSKLKLEPEKAYFISGAITGAKYHSRIFNFNFWTDSHGAPVAY